MKEDLTIWTQAFGREPCSEWANEEFPGIEILEYPPVTTGLFRKRGKVAADRRIVVTSGIRDHTGHEVEFIAFPEGDRAPGEPDGPSPEVDLFFDLVRFAAATQGQIHGGDTVTLVEPDGDQASYMLLLPFLEGPSWLPASSSNLEILEVFPIFEGELALKKSEGLESLISRFEEAGVPTSFSLNRTPVA